MLQSNISMHKIEESSENVRPISEQIVSTCISVYKTISAQLLPTPAKSHYTFNLRDLSKVFQGMTMVESKTLPV